MAEKIVDLIIQWRNDGISWQTIRERIETHYPGRADAMAEFELIRKQARAKNRNRGMVLLGIGSALCFLSMVYTFFFGHNYMMLYGLTIFGVSLAFAGLVFIMG